VEYQVATGLQNRGAQFYLPEIILSTAKGAKQPFFPGYLFIKVDFDTVAFSASVLGQASRVKVEVTDLEKLSPDKGAPTLRPPRRTRGRGRPITIH
jgi:hypothetical protein